MAGVAEKTGRKQRGKPFNRGESGNPGGRPPGSRNKATILIEALLDGEGEQLARKAIEMALAGDSAALRLCMDRIMPPRKDRPLQFAMPKMETAADAVKASAALVDAVASGAITPTEAGELSKLVDGFTKAVELHEIQQRLDKLEAAQGAK